MPSYEVLVTREVIEASAGIGVAFEPIDPVDLKGIAAPVELFRASRP